jgi:hypothetical protein
MELAKRSGDEPGGREVKRYRPQRITSKSTSECAWYTAWLVKIALMPASDPPNARVRGGAYAIAELRHVMLKVSKADQLMFYFGDLVPKESTVRVCNVQRINSGIDQAIANVPIGQHFFLCVWLSRLGRTMRQLADTCTLRGALLVIHEVNSSLVMFPWTKGIRIRLQIEMRVIQHVVSDPPKWVEIIAAGPQCVGTSLYRLSKHGERGVILAL